MEFLKKGLVAPACFESAILLFPTVPSRRDENSKILYTGKASMTVPFPSETCPGIPILGGADPRVRQPRRSSPIQHNIRIPPPVSARDLQALQLRHHDEADPA